MDSVFSGILQCLHHSQVALEHLSQELCSTAERMEKLQQRMEKLSQKVASETTNHCSNFQTGSEDRRCSEAAGG